MKHGPPIIAMTIPTPISLGAATVLPMVSAITSSAAPVNMENGISFMCLVPTAILDILGAKSPKKLIGPNITVEIPAKNTATTEICTFNSVTFTPKEAMVLSYVSGRRTCMVSRNIKQYCKY